MQENNENLQVDQEEEKLDVNQNLIFIDPEKSRNKMKSKTQKQIQDYNQCSSLLEELHYSFLIPADKPIQFIENNNSVEIQIEQTQQNEDISQILNQDLEHEEPLGSSLINSDMFQENTLQQNQDQYVGEAEIMVECCNSKVGCPHLKIPLDFIEAHEQFECEYRMVHCKRKGCQLKQPMQFKMLEIHQDFECEGDFSDFTQEYNRNGRLLSARNYVNVNQVQRNEEAKVKDELVKCSQCGIMILGSCMSDHSIAHMYEIESNLIDLQQIRKKKKKKEVQAQNDIQQIHQMIQFLNQQNQINEKIDFKQQVIRELPALKQVQIDIKNLLKMEENLQSEIDQMLGIQSQEEQKEDATKNSQNREKSPSLWSKFKNFIQTEFQIGDEAKKKEDQIKYNISQPMARIRYIHLKCQQKIVKNGSIKLEKHPDQRSSIIKKMCSNLNDLRDQYNTQLQHQMQRHLADSHHAIRNLQRRLRSNNSSSQNSESSSSSNGQMQQIRSRVQKKSAIKGLSQNKIDQFPQFKHIVSEDSIIQKKSENECMICMTDFDDKEYDNIKKDKESNQKYCLLRRLHCFHTFHIQCIDKWLLTNSKCPLCNMDQTDN